ncbi:MAG TPA: hypothetical protein PLC48_12615 [Ferruginibacter sp.]|nr:hypothetical protein [Ferruginibacter sp.]
MKIKPIFLAVILFYGCASKEKEKQLSQSYRNIESYLKETRIDDPDLLYFYSGKPRMPMPNVYAFDSLGRQVITPGNCFRVVDEYIHYLNDSIIPLKPEGETLVHFLDSSKIVDAYDQKVSFESLEPAHYYLFVDFIALPVESFKQTLAGAVNTKNKMPKNIELFLVHSLSEHNKKYFPQTPKKE